MIRTSTNPLLAAALLLTSSAHAAEFTGRLSLLGAFNDSGEHRLDADQQSVRLMLDETTEHGEWSLHLKSSRQRLQGSPTARHHSSDLFRYRPLDGKWKERQSSDGLLRIGYELDRAYYRHRFGETTLSLGRQPLDWGSGRLWQPMNLFGAFAPTDLDTDYKPGIDAALLDWYPSPFSALTAALVLSPNDDAATEPSLALHYRRQVGEESELSMVAGRINGDEVAGGAFESAWGGMGWRLEGVYRQRDDSGDGGLFWIAGLDNQFDDGTLLTAEWHHHDDGADDTSSLARSQSDPLAVYGLRQQLSRRVLGLSLNRDLTPLLNANYTLLTAFLEEGDGHDTSQLHQFNLTWSLSNESDLLLSLALTGGKGFDANGAPQSEFGHLPDSLTLRYRLYF